MPKDTVIVTGSSGLIGFPLCERLAAHFNVVGFDREGPPHPPKSVDAESVDLTSAENVRQALANVRERYGPQIASVIHLAAYYDFSGAPSPLYDKVTVGGTANLLAALKPFTVQQFIFSSTMLVHAPTQPGKPIIENGPIQPTWPYPESKVKTEDLLRAQRGKTPVVLMRIAGVYEDDGRSLPISHQIQRIYEKMLTSHFFPGNMSHGQSFVHLDDVLDSFERAVHRRAELPPELPLLIGEPEVMSYRDLQKNLGLLIHGKEWPTFWVPKCLAKAVAWLQEKIPIAGDPFIKPWMIDRADDHYEVDVGQAQKYLGWFPKRSLPETLPAMVAALKNDPAQWYRDNKLTPPRGQK
jgi:nucleoside-diphosphate-sugar epimerase